MTPISGKRKDPRFRRRLRVVFDHDPARPAYTSNVSRKGIAVISDFVAVPGSKIEAAVVLPDGQNANFVAVVAWARKARMSASLTAMNSMGLEFSIPPGELYNAFLTNAQPSHPPPAGLPVSNDAFAKQRQVTLGTSPQPPGPQPEQRSAGNWPFSPVGHKGQIAIMVDAKDFSATPERYPCSISLIKAAGWIEQAAVRSLVTILPASMVTIGLSIQVSVEHHPPVLVGDKLDIFTEVAEVGPDGKVLVFEARIESGKQEIGKGQMIRKLVGLQPL